MCLGRYDRPPSKKQLKDDDHFKETASYHKFQQSIERIKKKKNRQATDKETKHSDVAHKKVGVYGVMFSYSGFRELSNLSGSRKSNAKRLTV